MDFVVTLGMPNWGDWNMDGHPDGTTDQQEGTFMHELGHNLGLEHGGRDGINCKPNYLSVMSYSRQFSDILGNRPLDYSRNGLNPLNENSGLDEEAGLVASIPAGVVTAYRPGNGGAIQFRAAGLDFDWNGMNPPVGGKFVDKGVNADINNGVTADCVPPNPVGPNQMLTGNEDWNRIIYTFAGQGVAGGQGASSGIKQKPAPPERTAEAVRESRFILLEGVNEAIRELAAQSLNQPNVLSSQNALTTQVDPIINNVATLLRSNQVDAAINQLSELKTTADSSLGGNAADDIIRSPAAQKEVVDLINNLILTLQKQQ